MILTEILGKLGRNFDAVIGERDYEAEQLLLSSNLKNILVKISGLPTSVTFIYEAPENNSKHKTTLKINIPNKLLERVKALFEESGVILKSTTDPNTYIIFNDKIVDDNLKTIIQQIKIIRKKRIPNSPK